MLFYFYQKTFEMSIKKEKGMPDDIPSLLIYIGNIFIPLLLSWLLQFL